MLKNFRFIRPREYEVSMKGCWLAQPKLTSGQGQPAYAAARLRRGSLRMHS
ncbi:MAG TPA: hypothetical protein VFB63_09460 [Bryobacteraceae bacterium]|nr:hypothetical protein [Bryobacteraceae bacterium]